MNIHLICRMGNNSLTPLLWWEYFNFTSIYNDFSEIFQFWLYSWVIVYLKKILLTERRWIYQIKNIICRRFPYLNWVLCSEENDQSSLELSRKTSYHADLNFQTKQSKFRQRYIGKTNIRICGKNQPLLSSYVID